MRSARPCIPPLGPLALFMSDQVGAHRPHPVLVHAPALLRQPHRSICRGSLVTLGEKGARPIRVGAPRLVIAPHPLRLTIRTRARCARRRRARSRSRPFRGHRAPRGRRPRSDDRGENRTRSPPHAVGPPSPAPAVPTRSMSHGSSSWCSQVGDHASAGAPSPSGAPSLLRSSRLSFPCSGRGGCQWPRRSAALRSCASSPRRTRWNRTCYAVAESVQSWARYVFLRAHSGMTKDPISGMRKKTVQ